MSGPISSYQRRKDYEITISHTFDASGLVPKDLFIAPRACRLDSVQFTYDTNATAASQTVGLRKITDTSAADATAGATVVEMLSADLDVSTSGNVNTVQSGSLVADAGLTIRNFAAGDRLGMNPTGTMTDLVGLNLTLVFIPL